MEILKNIKAYKKIKKANNILLVAHDRPDGDALSSICAFIEFLESINKKYSAFCKDEPPYSFNFLPHLEKIKFDKQKLQFNNFDLIIALDCGNLSRTNLTQEIKNKESRQYIIEFDHHPKEDDYSDIEIRDPKAASTTEVLYSFFKTNQIKINKNIATAILTGILTDTGNLLYESTSDKTIKIASEMLLYGASFPHVLESTGRNKSLAAMKAWGEAMNNLKINEKYNFAYSVLSYKDLSKNNIAEEELEGIAGFLSNLYGVKGLVLLREEKNGLIKGSLRAMHPKIDISRLAVKLGGGGHKKASGFVIKGNLVKTKNSWKII